MCTVEAWIGLAAARMHAFEGLDGLGYSKLGRDAFEARFNFKVLNEREADVALIYQLYITIFSSLANFRS